MRHSSIGRAIHTSRTRVIVCKWQLFAALQCRGGDLPSERITAVAAAMNRWTESNVYCYRKADDKLSHILYKISHVEPR